MKTTLTRIGNSRGVIIPDHLLRQCQIDNIVLISVKDSALVISRPSQPRSGWADAFARTATGEQEMLLEDLPPNVFDDEEWEW